MKWLPPQKKQQQQLIVLERKNWVTDQQDGSYTMYWEQEVRHHGV